jgi:hypothetical protein
MIIIIIEGDSAVQSALAAHAPSLSRSDQRPLFCPCFRDLPWGAGLCRSCYRAPAHSLGDFSGLREADRLHVHHRKLGINDRDLLIALWDGCHARLHRLTTLRARVLQLLVLLWVEQHPDTPVQFQLPVTA